MITRRTVPRRDVAAVAAIVSLIAGCGAASRAGSDDASPAGQASDRAAQGREVSIDSGCAACHGADGEGGIGPAWTGLAGSERALQDGSTVVADRDYLRLSITNPDVDKVPGFTIDMPRNQLSTEEIELVIDYIETLR